MAQTTYITIALDRSGSMLEHKKATIEGFNNWLESTKSHAEKDGLDTKVTLLLFNHEVDTPINGESISQVLPLDETRYLCRGNTSLYDTLAEAIHTTSDKATPDDRVLAIVLTDGKDTSSREYSAESVRRLIEEKEALGNWSFLYLSSHPGAFYDARSMGVPSSSFRAYSADEYTRGETWNAMTGETQSYLGDGDTPWEPQMMTVAPDHSVLVENTERLRRALNTLRLTGEETIPGTLPPPVTGRVTGRRR